MVMRDSDTLAGKDSKTMNRPVDNYALYDHGALRMGYVFRNYDRGEAFRATDTPLLVVDTDLMIRDVNPAYLRATARTRDELLGTPIFEAFPDNPNDPQATGVTNLATSFETVFRKTRRDHMPLQRYDIPSNEAPAAFVRKFWIPVNSPLEEAGHVIGALHHVEDVTPALESVSRSGQSSSAGMNMDENTRMSFLAALAREMVGHKQARTTAEQLEHALTSRIQIEQAKGMIAVREAINVDEAFAWLRKHSRCHNAPIHEVARAVVERGLAV